MMLALLLLQAALAAAPCEDVVCVEVEKTKETVTFYAVSRADGVTISFSVSSVNMKPAAPPIVVRSLDRGRTKLMTLEATRGKQPQFEHGYFWEWGVLGATHDDRVSYRLPYESGRTFRLFQGPGGTLSHEGESAYDFPMPIGTPVRAARAGRVIEVVDAFGEGSSDPAADRMANEIMILHDDGTIGAYLHLLRGGMRVRVGDRVDAGTAIGLSGNSGRTTGPHLHFDVFRRSDGAKRRRTIPIRFRTADAETVVLEVGKFYRAD